NASSSAEEPPSLFLPEEERSLDSLQVREAGPPEFEARPGMAQGRTLAVHPEEPLEEQAPPEAVQLQRRDRDVVLLAVVAEQAVAPSVVLPERPEVQAEERNREADLSSEEL